MGPPPPNPPNGKGDIERRERPDQGEEKSPPGEGGGEPELADRPICTLLPIIAPKALWTASGLARCRVTTCSVSLESMAARSSCSTSSLTS